MIGDNPSINYPWFPLTQDLVFESFENDPVRTVVSDEPVHVHTGRPAPVDESHDVYAGF